MTRLNPVGYFVLVEPEVTEEKTASGIVLATNTVDANRLATDTGRVVKIGPMAWSGFGDGSPWAKEGDKVQFARYAGKRIKDPDNKDVEYILMNDNDILCTLKDA